MNFLFRLIIGFPCALFLSGFVVGFENVFALLVMSIICTAGIGAVPWIIVSYLIGTVLDLAMTARRRRIKKGELEYNLEGESTEMKAVSMYIFAAREQKMKDGEIRKNLLDNGWTEGMIDRAFDMV